MWSGLKYNSHTQPGERATHSDGSSLHSFCRLNIHIFRGAYTRKLSNIQEIHMGQFPEAGENGRFVSLFVVEK